MPPSFLVPKVQTRGRNWGKSSIVRDVPDFNEVGRDASKAHLEPDEDFLYAVAVDRQGGVAALLGVVGLLASGVIASRNGLPFGTSNVAVLTDQRLIVLPRLGRKPGRKPRGSVPLREIAGMRTGKFGRRPLLYIQPTKGKELRLLTVSSDPAPFVAAFETARVR